MNWLTLVFALALAASSLFAGYIPASLAQQPSADNLRKGACGCFVCGEMPGMHTVTFADKDCAGILAEDACGQRLAQLPKEQLERFCQRIKAKLNFTSFKDSCAGVAPFCGPPASGGGTSLPGGGGASLPPNPDRDGLADGFGGPPPALPAPPEGGLSPPRLVYFIMGVPGGGKPVTAFTVFLDRAACLVPIADNNQPSERAAAKYVVRGRISRGNGRVRIEAEASELAGGAKPGSVTGEADGEDAAAVVKATRAVTEKLKLVCAR